MKRKISRSLPYSVNLPVICCCVQMGLRAGADICRTGFRPRRREGFPHSGSLGRANYPTASFWPPAGLKVGDMVGKADLQAAADRMSALGLFASVSFSYKTARTAWSYSL